MNNVKVDALVIGGGIAGMQSALDLADQGFRSRWSNASPASAGKMITLSKVFPTLDCCSVHHHAEDVGGGAPSQHPTVHLLRSAVRERGTGTASMSPSCKSRAMWT
jgi:heterodisulfide reductase subunit A-like polyferredoxin